MRKPGVCTAQYPDLPLADFMRIITGIGFEAVFCGYWSDGETARKELDVARRFPVEIHSIHAPFNGINAMWEPGAAGEAMLARLTDAVDAAAEYGVPHVVVHLSSGDQAPCVNDLGHARFDRLVDHAVEKNIVIAFENQRKLANLAFVMELYQGVPQVGFCWDTGHEACFTPGREYMPLFGDRLCCLHLHDNSGVHNADQHLIPMDGSIDFKRVTRQIAAAGYQGPMMLEVVRRPAATNGYSGYESMTYEEYYRHAFSACRKLCEMTETN